MSTFQSPAQPRRLPLDYDAIQKGHTIPASLIEQITRCSVNSRVYPFKQMQIAETITRELARRPVDPIQVVVRSIGNDLRILTDEEAVPHTAALFKKRFVGMKRAARQMVHIDRSQLTPAMQSEHERNLIVASRTVQAATGARREAIKLTSHQRTVPGMLLKPTERATTE